MFKFVLLTVLVLAVVGGNGRMFHLAKPHLDGRIVGGSDAAIEDFPHQLSLEYYGGHRCGASVVSSTVVVTAAHCTANISPDSLKIRAGTDTVGQGGVLVSIKEIYVHEKYNSAIIDFDVSVIILDEPLQFSNKISPIGLPEQDDAVPAGTAVTITGWGATSEGGWGSDILQQVTVPVVDQDVCASAYAGYDITPRMICAGLLNEGGKDACQGDSGGPLITNGKLQGIVSWGIGCAERNYPGVYTRVASVRDWIRSKSGV